MVTEEDLTALIFNNSSLDYAQSQDLAVIILKEFDVNVKTNDI